LAIYGHPPIEESEPILYLPPAVHHFPNSWKPNEYFGCPCGPPRLGQDLAIGYDRHAAETVTLYFTESFTFRILEPAAVIHYTAEG
jgi:hypothetical protein